MNQTNVNSQYKDNLFRDIFNNQTNLLALYNGIAGTAYTNTNDIKINTIDNVICNDIRNDVSFQFRDKFIVLLEHQSTVNNNMPLRCLLYAAKIYQNMLEGASIYREKLINLPTPDFYVLYNGTKPYPVKATMRLSDAFRDKGSSSMELEVTVYNINYDKNIDLLNRCKPLNDYSFLVHKVREYGEHSKDLTTAAALAIDYCIKNDIMKDYLLKRQKEVINMLANEWNWDDAKRIWQEEAREDGIQEGIQEGISKGAEKQNLAVTVSMLNKKLTLELIADVTKLSFDKIKQIADENNIKISKKQLAKTSSR